MSEIVNERTVIGLAVVATGAYAIHRFTRQAPGEAASDAQTRRDPAVGGLLGAARAHSGCVPAVGRQPTFSEVWAAQSRLLPAHLTPQCANDLAAHWLRAVGNVPEEKFTSYATGNASYSEGGFFQNATRLPAAARYQSYRVAVARVVNEQSFAAIGTLDVDKSMRVAIAGLASSLNSVNLAALTDPKSLVDYAGEAAGQIVNTAAKAAKGAGDILGGGIGAFLSSLATPLLLIGAGAVVLYLVVKKG